MYNSDSECITTGGREGGRREVDSCVLELHVCGSDQPPYPCTHLQTTKQQLATGYCLRKINILKVATQIWTRWD